MEGIVLSVRQNEDYTEGVAQCLQCHTQVAVYRLPEKEQVYYSPPSDADIMVNNQRRVRRP